MRVSLRRCADSERARNGVCCCGRDARHADRTAVRRSGVSLLVMAGAVVEQLDGRRAVAVAGGRPLEAFFGSVNPSFRAIVDVVVVDAASSGQFACSDNWGALIGWLVELRFIRLAELGVLSAMWQSRQHHPFLSTSTCFIHLGTPSILISVSCCFSCLKFQMGPCWAQNPAPTFHSTVPVDTQHSDRYPSSTVTVATQQGI